jgi:cytoskeletal protein CcmA (bactofilin family)
MFFKKSNIVQSTIDTLIGADTRIEGNLVFTGGLRIDGIIIGDISESNINPGTVILSEHGSIEGSVSATKMVVNGKVVGPIRCNQFIELQPKAHVTGDVYYKSLEMHTGAVVEGRLIYLGTETEQIEKLAT